jgi:endonuclease/exonuclease/phosphatase family metal-dependent hydrolase
VDAPTASDRAHWAESLGDQDLHRHLIAHLACLHEVESHQHAAAQQRTPLSGWVRVVAWNAERGGDAPRAAELLRNCAGDVLLLSELDSGMARTGDVHVARVLAELLGTGYGYGVEFVELVGDNTRGLHGNAILTAARLEDPAVMRLGGEGAWFKAGSTEPRVGGRMAVLATLEVDGTPVRFASTHLENMTEPNGRAAQLETLLQAIGPGPEPAVVAGDLNTFGVALEELSDRAAVRRMRARAPVRFTWPVDTEPLFEVARAHGFTWTDANVAAPTTSHDPLGLPDHVPLKLDWILVRGLEARRPAVTSCDGLSDHEVVSVAVRVPAVPAAPP